MNLDHPHSLGKDDAKARLELLGQYLKSKHGIVVTWEGDKGRFDGKYLVVKIQGEFDVDEAVVRLRGKDPGMLWRKKATDYMRNKLEKYLNAATPAAELPTS